MPSGDAIFQAAAELETQGVPFVLATVVRCEPPTSAKPGAKAIVLADGSLTGWIGGGCAQPAVISVARKAIADGQPRLVRISPGREGRVEEGVVDFGMACHSGGSLDIFLEPIGARPGLLVVGTSGTARALTSMAAATGFDVFVAGHGADSATFPAARQVIDGMDLSGLMRRQLAQGSQAARVPEGARPRRGARGGHRVTRWSSGACPWCVVTSSRCPALVWTRSRSCSGTVPRRSSRRWRISR